MRGITTYRISIFVEGLRETRVKTQGFLLTANREPKTALSLKTYALALLFIVSCLLSPILSAQNPALNFKAESITIGDEVTVSLVFRHAPEAEVFFPNEASYFTPFELNKTDFFTTRTQDSISTDSVIYHISTFEIDKIQFLSLPVWIVQGTDSTTFYSNMDSIFLEELILDSALAHIQLESATELLNNATKKPIPPWLKVVFGILLFLGLLALFFREQIERQIKIYKFQKIHKEFNTNFKRLMKNEPVNTVLEEANALWRDQMAWIEDKPYNSLSSLEIGKITKSEKLSQAIREIESTLFGGQKSERIPLALQILYNFANQCFRKRFIDFKKTLKGN